LFGDCEQQQLTAHLIYDAVAESYIKKWGDTIVLHIFSVRQTILFALLKIQTLQFTLHIFIIVRVNNLHLAIVLLLESQKVG
jgi:hypothetical protein